MLRNFRKYYLKVDKMAKKRDLSCYSVAARLINVYSPVLSSRVSMAKSINMKRNE